MYAVLITHYSSLAATPNPTMKSANEGIYCHPRDQRGGRSRDSSKSSMSRTIPGATCQIASPPPRANFALHATQACVHRFRSHRRSRSPQYFNANVIPRRVSAVQSATPMYGPNRGSPAGLAHAGAAPASALTSQSVEATDAATGSPNTTAPTQNKSTRAAKTPNVTRCLPWVYSYCQLGNRAVALSTTTCTHSIPPADRRHRHIPRGRTQKCHKLWLG